MDAVAAATESARQLQEQQLGALAGAWQGRGGDASHEFLLRHGEASDAAAAAVRNAVDAFTALRDDLWHTVDEKVAATVAIDDRRQAERAEWLAATHTVTTGAGDRAAASELIDQQVKPFVDNDIRSDWLSAMQTAMAAVAAAFDTATAALTGPARARLFEVPGDLGPSSPPASSAPAAEGAHTAPAAWTSPAPAAAPAVGPMASPTPAFPTAPEPVAPPMPAAPMPATAPAASATPAMPTMPSLGDLGSGLPGAAGGLAGLGQQLADAFGGLLNRPEDALPDPPDPNEEPENEEPVPDDEEPEEVPDHETAKRQPISPKPKSRPPNPTTPARTNPPTNRHWPSRRRRHHRHRYHRRSPSWNRHRAPSRSAVKPRVRSPPTSYPRLGHDR